MRVFISCLLVVCGLVYSQLLVAEKINQNANQGSQQEESWLAKLYGYLNYLRTTTEKKRVALVIGNGNYINNEYNKQQQPSCIGGWCLLKTPVNDANKMTVALTELGFSVILVKDADLYRMNEAIDEFVNQLNENTEALFYFSGHGAQNSRSQSLLVPVDAPKINDSIQTKEEFEKSEEPKLEATIKLDYLLSKMKEKRSPTNIIILDACRDSPGENLPSNPTATPNTTSAMIESGSERPADGFEDDGQQRLSDGFLIAYATAPGRISAGGNDKERDNSLYTQFLLEYISHPGPYHVIFEKVRQDIVKYHVTHPPKDDEEKKFRYQMPWESNSLRQTFYFVPRKLNVHGGFQ